MKAHKIIITVLRLGRPFRPPNSPDSFSLASERFCRLSVPASPELTRFRGRNRLTPR